MQRLLTQEQDQLLRQQRSLLEDLRLQLSRLEASEEDLDLLKRTLRQMEELFLLVVVGEFNAGKTAFLNALMGSRLLQEGVTPTTSAIHLLRYGERLHQETSDGDVLTIYVPVDWLREVNLVDTPGTNAVIQRHQEITEHFVPRSDLILFVTSADRPFSESERLFLQRIRQWGKKVIIVLNKIDLIEEESEQQEIVDFVAENARTLLGIDPQIFPVSSRLALRAKEAAKNGHPDASMWSKSRFEPLEIFMLEQLDARERLRLKLENPLGVADNLIETYSKVVNDRQDLLRGDFQTLDTIEEQLAGYEVDMRRDFRYQLSHVDNLLYEMAERGDKFFDDAMRLGRIFDLMNGDKLRSEFERQVVGDTSRAIERQVSELIDWMVDKDYRQWQAVIEYLNRRAAQHADRIVGSLASNFEFNRQNLLASVGREAQHVVDSYDREAESLKLAQEVQTAIIQTAAVEVGALGLGALLVTLLHTTLLDITGILGAGVVAALGLYVLPARRSKVKNELRNQVNQLRDQLSTAMTRQFETELKNSAQRLRESIAPYTRFVRIEREKLDRMNDDLQNARRQANTIRAQIDKVL